MSKRWTEHEPRTGNVVSPDSVNDEFRTHQSSMTTLDRDQLPANYVDDTRTVPFALHRAWVGEQFPTSTNESGEQQAARDTAVSSRMWQGISYQGATGAWQNLSSAGATLSGFKGGSLFLEWSGCGYIYPAFADTLALDYPFNPKYLRLRILVNGVVLCERRGCYTHEHFRVFGSQQFPPGDLNVRFQFKVTPNGPDDALTVSGGNNVMQAHLYSNKFLAIGRFR